MDEVQINMTIKPIFIERIIYWVIIAILAILLIITWAKGGSCATNATGKVTETTQATAPPATPPPTETAPPAATPTCTDATKNGDETDVDCGGSCSVKCASGRSCKVNSDCVSNICTNSVCTNTAPQTLSGSLTLNLDSINTLANPGNGTYHTYKVTSVTYTIKNGLSADITPHAKIFVKDQSGASCLNEYTTDDAQNCGKAYAEFDIGRIASGKTLSTSTDIPGTYVMQAVGNSYDPSDPSRDQFKVVMYLYDQDGNPINGKTLSAAYTFSP